ncbi:ABC transporter permease [Desulfurococcaceae archaeon MEX13E-LK6-19]|nr:ABC transporter permease [Desulfurococcaceae archaeon MEX13E-LK6-19]
MARVEKVKKIKSDIMETMALLSRKTVIKEIIHDWVIVPGKVLIKNKKAFVGFLILMFYIFMATIGPYITPYPRSFTCPIYLKPTLLKWPPSLEHPLGCDYFGKDIWAQIVWGAPIVLKIAFIAGLITTLVGITIGMIAGFKGGIVDSILMSLTDIVMTIPGLPLLIVLASVIRASDPWVIGLMLSVTAWAGLARSIRSQVLSIKEREFIEAAKALGLSTGHIVFKEIMPNLMSYIAINFIFATTGAIYASVGLYFLGVLPFTSFNWGIMLNMAYAQAGALHSINTIHYILAPILAVIGLQVGLILFSYAVDEMFNPRLRTEL